MKRAFILTMALVVLSATALGCTASKDQALNFNVGGQVSKAGTYNLDDYKDKLITINAKLDGQVTHLPAQNYTGVPLRLILSDAGAKDGSTNVTISASDGYVQTFDYANVTSSDNLILINQNDTVRLVAKGYVGGYWVEQVKAIEVS
ncbi:MAG TPA: molybdopterin-dependent oxidoreductase [Methanocellaceae archaeon]|jgi:energy-coupling factor transport system substrate-specific component